ncbi:MAG: insulinase family protein [Alphaproteobacteria bacterium]|nr:insulinase family protein [Alphaproteobacteria bacterium]
MTYQLSTLQNGLRVASEHLPGMESIAIAMSVDVGARHEEEAEGGLSHLLEHMAFKGTSTRSARDIAESFDAIGGQFNAYTSLEHTVYYAKVLKEHLPLAVDILSDILLHSVFDPQELKREQGVVLQEIASHFDAPDDLIFDLLDRTAFPDQPLGRSILSTPERIMSHTREALVTYMEKHYAAPRMVLSAAGNVKHEMLLDLAERYLAPLSPGVPRPPVVPGRYVGGDDREADDLEQLHLLLGLPALSAHDDDYYALQLYSSILGGGMSSRLFQEIREKRGLAYHVSSMTAAYADCGMMNVYCATGENEAAELPMLLADEIKRMAGGVTEAELSRVRNQQKAELLMARENPGRVAGWIGRHLLVFERYKPLKEIIANIEAVTHDDMRRVGALLLEGMPTLAALGPIGKLPPHEAVAGRLLA